MKDKMILRLRKPEFVTWLTRVNVLGQQKLFLFLFIKYTVKHILMIEMGYKRHLWRFDGTKGQIQVKKVILVDCLLVPNSFRLKGVET